jgi:hypothetical protein
MRRRTAGVAEDRAGKPLFGEPGKVGFSARSADGPGYVAGAAVAGVRAAVGGGRGTAPRAGYGAAGAGAGTAGLAGRACLALVGGEC